MNPFNYHFQETNDPRYVTLKIVTSQSIDNNTIEYLAAHPPDTRNSFSGSALPFPNQTQAFHNTPTNGKFQLQIVDNSKKCKEDNECKKEGKLTFAIPNAYYTDLGNTYIKPHLNLRYKQNGVTKKLELNILDSIPHRTLTHPFERTSPLFYQPDNHVASQEVLLRKTAYPTSWKFTSS